jgi:hypothetical protein
LPPLPDGIRGSLLRANEVNRPFDRNLNNARSAIDPRVAPGAGRRGALDRFPGAVEVRPRLDAVLEQRIRSAGQSLGSGAAPRDGEAPPDEAQRHDEGQQTGKGRH